MLNTFEVSADIPLRLKLQAYDKRATKEELVNYFTRLVNPDDFDIAWRDRDDDVFFEASVKGEQ